jgi:hypothetical protein
VKVGPVSKAIRCDREAAAVGRERLLGAFAFRLEKLRSVGW